MKRALVVLWLLAAHVARAGEPAVLDITLPPPDEKAMELSLRYQGA